MATANMKDVKRRIKSVESTMQITKAMELVASSKMRKAKERAEAVSPFFNTLYETMCAISADREFSSMFLNKSISRGVLMLVIAGDRGLAGGFNHNVLKKANQRAEELAGENREVFVIAIGKKAVEYFAKRPYTVICGYSQIAESLNIYETGEIANEIISRFKHKLNYELNFCNNFYFFTNVHFIIILLSFSSVSICFGFIFNKCDIYAIF